VTYSLQFTERMIGAFSFGEDNYEAGFRPGRTDANGILFRLTIGTADVSAFIADPRHEAVPTGYIKCESLGGTLPVLDGAFNLFVDEGGAIRHMLYRLYFADATGRPLTLAGFKNVNPGPITRVWPETSTLYTRILSGHIPVSDGGETVSDGIVGSGILHIRPLDFAVQLTTFRVHGPTWSGRVRALDEFGTLFMSELWQVFNPLRGKVRHG
jgi:cholesterol oxidase